MQHDPLDFVAMSMIISGILRFEKCYVLIDFRLESGMMECFKVSVEEPQVGSQPDSMQQLNSI